MGDASSEFGTLGQVQHEYFARCSVRVSISSEVDMFLTGGNPAAACMGACAIAVFSHGTFSARSAEYRRHVMQADIPIIAYPRTCLIHLHG